MAFTLDNPIRRLLQPPERLISKLNIRPSDVVVDFGCGPGFFAVPLAKVAARTIAVDISLGMLERAASYAKKRSVTVEFLKSNGTEIRLPNETADLIFLHHVFHEIDHRPEVLREFHRIMKPPGRLDVVERVRGSRLFAGKLGPPVIDPLEVVREMEAQGFTVTQTVAHGSDSIIVGQKP